MEPTSSMQNENGVVKKHKKFVPPVAKPGLAPGDLKPKEPISTSTSNIKPDKKLLASSSNPDLKTSSSAKPSSSAGIIPKQPPATGQDAVADGSGAISKPSTSNPQKKLTKPAKLPKSKHPIDKKKQAKGENEKQKKNKTAKPKSALDEEEALSEESVEEVDSDEEDVDEEDDEIEEVESPNKDSDGNQTVSKKYKAPIGLFSKRTRESLIAKYHFLDAPDNGSKVEDEDVGNDGQENSNSRKSLQKKKPLPVLCLSGFNTESKSIQIRLAKSLKLQIQETEMLKFDLLVVDGEKPVRTKKVLFALVRHVPIVNSGYLFLCSGAGKLLDPLAHQTSAFPKIGSRPKYDKLFEKISINVDIVQFEAGFDYPSIYGLLKLCKASLVQDPKQADMIVSNKSVPKPRVSESPGAQETRKVHQTWVFDCIEEGQLLDNSKYLF